MHQRESTLGHHLAEALLAVREGDALLDDLGAEGAGRRHLGRVRVFRNQDQGRQPDAPRGKGDRLGMVARADRDHARGTLLRLDQREHRVEGSPRLE